MKKLVLGLFLTSFVITSLLLGLPTNATSVEKKVEMNLNGMSDRLLEEIESKSELSLSSNPYDYIRNSVEYKNIVNLGYEALPVLEDKIDRSPGSGLIDYILAIAIEEISKVDLKKKELTTWDTGDRFSESWKKHLNEIPNSVLDISNSSASIEQKNKDLIELGVAAIPFILDEVESGNEEILPAAEELLKGNDKITSNHQLSKKEWISQAKSQVDDLKRYVLSK